MPNDKELLQQALDVLEDWDSLIQHQYNGSKEAMSDLTVCAQSTSPIIEAIKARLAQPEPKPVEYDVNGATVYIKPPLYTAPPQREWVGLTAYEIQEIHFSNPHFGNFACAIEAKLKEKNT